jgi:aarF domain-containing kinase
MKSSFTARSAKLLGLAAQVGSREITQAFKDRFGDSAAGKIKTRIEQAKLITENLSQLKGAAMKAGQLLSLDASDFIPPEAVEILSRLQGKAEPVDWSVMRNVLIDELGDAKIKDFEKLSTTPAASASIGQVHRGRLFDTEVAVKIQYPGISETIDSDLKILKTIAQSMLSLTGKRIELADLFKELRAVLHQEADYRLELENMREYAEHLRGDPQFVVPKAIDSHSSTRVLTMSWEHGTSIAEWLKTSPTADSRETIARLLLDLYCKEFFQWGLVQTDPNYGNFLIRTDGAELKLVVLDFGATLRYTPEFQKKYVELLKVMATRDRDRIAQSFVDSGFIDARESKESFEFLSDMILTSLEPFQIENQPFKFTDDDYTRRTREVTRKFTQSLKYSAPPKQIIFLHRKLGGVFAFVKKLDVQMDVSPYWRKMVGAELDT